MLTFLFLFSLLTSLLTPVLLDKTYSQTRADYNSRLSAALTLSEQAYWQAASPPRAASVFSSIGSAPFAMAGYYDEAQLAAFKQSLPIELQNWSFSRSPPPSPSPSRICVSRQMMDASSGQLHALWVCEP
ncbi:Uncharacterised protein [uncultured archaeon]|nr:Uncharacterised protein [uncultured archaeon]